MSMEIDEAKKMLHKIMDSLIEKNKRLEKEVADLKYENNIKRSELIRLQMQISTGGKKDDRLNN